MIVAIGTDIVSLERIRKIIESDTRDRFLKRTFAPPELEYAFSKSDPVPSLAVRFAAKEAFQKCWLKTHAWTDVWVEFNGVKPQLHFAPVLQTVMLERGWVTHLSLSHEREHATAMVVLEEVKNG
jgi:holo-[acyl-carrier protein] synthase